MNSLDQRCVTSDSIQSEIACEICGMAGQPGVTASPLFTECADCGHQTRRGAAQLSSSENEVLSLDAIKKLDRLTSEKLAVVRKLHTAQTTIIDVGASSGKFLYHIKGDFERAYGIEVSPRASEFCRSVLKLEIGSSAQSIPTGSNIVTFWHSLEHIPLSDAEEIIRQLVVDGHSSSLVVVAVPNIASIQWKLFGVRWTYYDSVSHLYQFTGKSLDILMTKYGLERVARTTMVSYSLFGYLQSFVNTVIAPHNFLYFRLKRGSDLAVSGFGAWWRVLASLCLIGIFFIPSLLLMFLERVLPGSEGVIIHSYIVKASGTITE